jgi:hypothetical protein
MLPSHWSQSLETVTGVGVARSLIVVVLPFVVPSRLRAAPDVYGKIVPSCFPPYYNTNRAAVIPPIGYSLRCPPGQIVANRWDHRGSVCVRGSTRGDGLCRRRMCGRFACGGCSAGTDSPRRRPARRRRPAYGTAVSWPARTWLCPSTVSVHISQEQVHYRSVRRTDRR